MSEASEVWKPIAGYESLYAVSNLGRIQRTTPGKNTYPGRILKPVKMANGYHCVRLGRGAPLRRVHRIVADAFLGAAPSPAHEINHKNGVKTDNRHVNLEWVTRQENIRHAIDVLGRDYGKHLAGGPYGRGKPRLKRRIISDAIIAGVKARLSEGQNMAATAREFGIGETTVQRIRDNTLRIGLGEE